MLYKEITMLLVTMMIKDRMIARPTCAHCRTPPPPPLKSRFADTREVTPTGPGSKHLFVCLAAVGCLCVNFEIRGAGFRH